MPDGDWGHVPRVSGLPKTGPGDTYPGYMSPDETDGFRLFLIR
jgi:hypothetical protein